MSGIISDIVLNARIAQSKLDTEARDRHKKQNLMLQEKMYDGILAAWDAHGIPHTVTNDKEIDEFLDTACLLYRGFIDEYKVEVGIAFLVLLAKHPNLPSSLTMFHKVAMDAAHEYVASMKAESDRFKSQMDKYLTDFHAKIQKDLIRAGFGDIDDDVY